MALCQIGYFSHQQSAQQHREIRGESIRPLVEENRLAVKLFHKLATEQERTALVVRLTAEWRKQDKFHLLRGWRESRGPSTAGTTSFFIAWSAPQRRLVPAACE